MPAVASPRRNLTLTPRLTLYRPHAGSALANYVNVSTFEFALYNPYGFFGSDKVNSVLCTFRRRQFLPFYVFVLSIYDHRHY